MIWATISITSVHFDNHPIQLRVEVAQRGMRRSREQENQCPENPGVTATLVLSHKKTLPLRVGVKKHCQLGLLHGVKAVRCTDAAATGMEGTLCTSPCSQTYRHQAGRAPYLRWWEDPHVNLDELRTLFQKCFYATGFAGFTINIRISSVWSGRAKSG